VPGLHGGPTGTYIGWNIYITAGTVKIHPGLRFGGEAANCLSRLRKHVMPMFLATGPYTSAGVSGLASSGAVQRAAQLAAMAKGLGGRLEAMYFGLSESDTYIVLELPDTATATAIAKAVNAAGTGYCKMQPILTPQEMDDALKIDTRFAPPGS
jgi:uncharacterized protein with GYD domain